MNWIDKIMNKIPKQTKYASTLSGRTPIFGSYITDVYASDTVKQAIGCIAAEMSKLNPVHEREYDGDILTVNGSIQKMMNNPNEFMTTADFIEKMTWNLFIEYNSFAVPVYTVWKGNDGTEKRSYKAIYPIKPMLTTFIEDASGKLYAEFTFSNGFKTVFPYEDVIHLRYQFSKDDFMGGNESGQPDNEAILKTLKINDSMMEGILKAMKSSFVTNGVVKYGGIIGKESTEKNVKEFEQQLQNSESGILGLDAKSDYIQIKRDIKMVDSDTVKFIDEKISRNYGVSQPILSGDYTKQQYEAFYQKTLEPLILKFSQEFKKKLFTQRERDHGNQIYFYQKDTILMSVTESLETVRLLGDSGALFENEKRKMLGLKPLPELEGVRKQSLNYVDVDIARDYQLNAQKKDEKQQEGEKNGGEE